MSSVKYCTVCDHPHPGTMTRHHRIPLRVQRAVPGRERSNLARQFRQAFPGSTNLYFPCCRQCHDAIEGQGKACKRSVRFLDVVRIRELQSEIRWCEKWARDRGYILESSKRKQIARWAEKAQTICT